MEILGWIWEMMWFSISFEKKNYCSRIFPSYNMPGKVRCYTLGSIYKEISLLNISTMIFNPNPWYICMYARFVSGQRFKLRSLDIRPLDIHDLFLMHNFSVLIVGSLDIRDFSVLITAWLFWVLLYFSWEMNPWIDFSDLCFALLHCIAAYS